MTSYEYENLIGDQIRLVTLLPGQSEDDLELSISRVTLTSSDAPPKLSLRQATERLPPGWQVHEDISQQLFYRHENNNGEWESQWAHPDPGFDTRPYKMGRQRHKDFVAFEALSYTWGSTAAPVLAKVIPAAGTMDDQLSVATLKIGQNLAVALRHLRYDDRPRTLWIDAICINQENVAERNEQVKRASNVYKEAERVVIWLGVSSHDSALAIRTLDHLGTQLLATSRMWVFEAPGATEKDWCNVPLPYDQSTWSAINSLLSRPWFSRVWIIQELQLAENAVFLCGKDEMLRNRFGHAVAALNLKDHLDPVLSRALVHDVTGLAIPIRSDSTIYHIVRRTCNGNCTNNRDVIYGALGLFTPSFRQRITVDYELPTQDVYADFVRSHISHVQRLELLRLCEFEPRRPGLPSWVPDFEVATMAGTAVGNWSFCSGYSRCDLSSRGAVLEVAGVYGATIQSAGRVVPDYTKGSETSFADSVHAVRGLSDDFPDDPAVKGGTWAFLWAFIGSFLKDRLPGNMTGLGSGRGINIGDSMIFGTGNPEDALGGGLSHLEDYCMKLLMGRRLLKTVEGGFSLGPAAAEEGDIVVCLLGLDAPMVLRKTADESYLVIGECLMPDLADLKCFLGPLPFPWEIRYFTDNADGAGLYQFKNTQTGELHDQDPRLTYSDDMELIPRCEVERTGDDPMTFQIYRNRVTGAITKSDPMLTPEALKAAGVPVRRFALI